MAALLVNQVYNSMLASIAKGEYGPGDRLPSEHELSEIYGVSRNTLRAALYKLNVLGFTETRHGGGTYIRKVGSEVYLNFFVPAILLENHSLIDVLEFRKGIELESVRLAAERASEEDIQRLRELLEHSKCSQEEMREFAYHNTHYHAAIVQASHNSMFIKMMEIISNIIIVKMQDFLTDQGKDIDSTFYHSMLFECIVNKKPDEAAFFMEKHLTKVIDRVKNFNDRNQ